MIEITEAIIETKKGSVLSVKIYNEGDWHVYNGQGQLIQRFKNPDSANIVVVLLNKNALGGPFIVRGIMSDSTLLSPAY